MRLVTPTTLTLAAALALSACSQEKAADDARPMAGVPAEAAAGAGDAATASEAGPGIGGVVAPGVAFTYAYAFTLPAEAISNVQQEHAAACTRLGPTRCRVTGMNYEKPGEDRVSARLDLLLAPDLAHRFGTEGIAAVERAEGKLERASVNGENAGDAIQISQEDSAAIEAEVARLEARLRAKGLADQERVELQRRVSELRDQLRGEAAHRRDKEEAIATTPVSFNYASEGLIGGNTFGKAASASLNSIENMLAFLMLLAGVALPWIGLGALGVLAYRWFKRRTSQASEPAPTT